jgi:hypothetical protein
MVFSRFLSTTIFIPAENTQHSEKPGQNSVLLCIIIRWVGRTPNMTVSSYQLRIMKTQCSKTQKKISYLDEKIPHTSKHCVQTQYNKQNKSYCHEFCIRGQQNRNRLKTGSMFATKPRKNVYRYSKIIPCIVITKTCR